MLNDITSYNNTPLPVQQILTLIMRSQIDNNLLIKFQKLLKTLSIKLISCTVIQANSYIAYTVCAQELHAVLLRLKLQTDT